MTPQQLVEKCESLPAEAQKRTDDLVAILSLKYQSSSDVEQSELPIEDEPFVGMWQGTSHLEDSAQWVRDTRKAHWGQKR